MRKTPLDIAIGGNRQIVDSPIINDRHQRFLNC